MRKFNYILNDIAFDTLVIKCLYGEPTDEDIEKCENQIKLLQQENQTNKTIIEKQVKRIYELEHTLEELKKYLEDDWSSVNGEIASKLILDKIKELEEGE